MKQLLGVPAWAATVGVCALLAAFTSPSSAQQPLPPQITPPVAPAPTAADPLADIRARLEQLERENAALRRNAAPLPTTANARVVPAAALNEATSGDAEKDKELRERVAKILKDLEAEKKKEADEKKKQAQEEGVVVGSDLSMTASWRNGLILETPNKDFRVHIGGRTQVDSVWMDADPQVMFGPGGVGRVDDAVAFRRARFAIEGQVWEVFQFNFEYDFLNTVNVEAPDGSRISPDTPAPTDMWIQVDQLPVIGHFRIGNQKPPIGFEHITSSRFLNFMERSFGWDAFLGGLDNGFRPGIQAFDTLNDERMTWAIGVFKNNQTVFGYNVGDGEWDLTARFTGLPIYEQDGACLMHLGVGASHRELDNDRVRFRARTQVRNGPPTLTTALLDMTVGGTSEDIVVPEFVVVAGPWTIQSEYMAVWVQNTTSPVGSPTNLGATFYQTAYFEVLYFLTGEHRVYDRKYPRFDRVVPNENFWMVKDSDGGVNCGWGAWQVGVRYDWIDLTDGAVKGGTAQDLTLGLNWFWNPNCKLQFNCSIGHRDLPTGDSNGYVTGFGMRYAFDF